MSGVNTMRYVITSGKIYTSLANLEEYVGKMREQGKTIVVTSGTFDILHVGHGRYLNRASMFGHVLIVGVDSDEKVRDRKGDSRPIVRQHERVEMLEYLSSVTAIYIKPLSDPKWALIMTVRPDTLVISKRSGYSDGDVEKLKEYCGKVEVLDSMAETSTTAKIRQFVISAVAPMISDIDVILPLMGSLLEKLIDLRGDD